MSGRKVSSISSPSTLNPLRLAQPSSWPNRQTASFAITNFLATTSTGLVITTIVVFFTSYHGFDITSLTQIASIGSFIGLVAIPIMGRLARTFSSHTVYTFALLIQSLVLFSWLMTFGSMISASALIVFSLSTATVSATVGGLITELEVPSDVLATTRAALRTTTNIGIGLGGLVAALLLKIGSGDTRSSILLAGILTLLAFLTMAFHKSSTPGAGSERILRPRASKPTISKPKEASYSNPYRDARYVGLFVSNGLLSTHTEVLTYLIPAVVLLTFPERISVVGLATAINACVIILFQLRNTERAAKLGRRKVTTVAATATVTMTILLACSTHLGERSALICLLGSVVALTIGELWQSSAEFDISYAAAPQGNHQEYQAAYAFGRTLARSIAPIAFGWIVFNGPWGWLLLGIVYLVAGAVHIALASSIHITKDISVLGSKC